MRVPIRPLNVVVPLSRGFRSPARGDLGETLTLIYSPARSVGGIKNFRYHSRSESSNCASWRPFDEETAEAMRIGHATVERDWKMARAGSCGENLSRRINFPLGSFRPTQRCMEEENPDIRTWQKRRRFSRRHSISRRKFGCVSIAACGEDEAYDAKLNHYSRRMRSRVNSSTRRHTKRPAK